MEMIYGSYFTTIVLKICITLALGKNLGLQKDAKQCGSSAVMAKLNKKFRNLT